MNGGTIRQLDRPFAERRAEDLLNLISEFPDVHWTLDSLLLELPGKWDVSRVVEDEGYEIRALAVNSLKDESLYIHLFLVAPSYRRRGVGRDLVENLAEVGRATPAVSRLRLRTSMDWPAAWRFYQQSGFRVEQYFEAAREYLLERPL